MKSFAHGLSSRRRPEITCPNERQICLFNMLSINRLGLQMGLLTKSTVPVRVKSQESKNSDL